MLQSKNNKNNAPWSELTYLVIFTIISILECFCSIFFCFVFSDKQKKRLVCWERIYIFLKIQCDIKSEVLKKRRKIFQERKLLNLNGKNLHRFSMVLIAGEFNTALWMQDRVTCWKGVASRGHCFRCINCRHELQHVWPQSSDIGFLVVPLNRVRQMGQSKKSGVGMDI